MGVMLLVVSGYAQRCGFPQWLERSEQERILLSQRPALPLFYETPDGRFRLHYTLQGADAVPAEDADGNGVPDYIETAAGVLQHVLHVLRDSLGYPELPSDGGEGGSEAYDVYFLNLGALGLYGETVPERLLPQGAFPRFTSFLKLDNDYSPADSFQGRPTYRETGERALRIAIAHELYHAVQFAHYGIASWGILLYELASTFMEWRIFPDIRDYEQFLPDLFQRPEEFFFGDAYNGATGYRFALFGQYLYLRWGDGIFRRMWERIGQGRHPYVALDTALREVQASLAAAWCEFLPWLYYTGTRARPGYFPQAAEFPQVRFGWTGHFSPPTAMSSGQLRPFEFRFLRVLFPQSREQTTPDTFDLGVSRPDLEAVVRGEQGEGAGYTLVCGFLPEGEPIVGTPYAFRLQGEADMCYRSFWNAGFPFQVVSKAYPQPYRVGVDEKLCLPVPASVSLGAKGEAELYTAAFAGAARFAVTAELDGDRMVCCVGPLDLPPGVYLYRLLIAGSEVWGKVVLRVPQP